MPAVSLSLVFFACFLRDSLPLEVFCAHVQTLTKRGKKQVVPEGLYDALIAVVDLMQKMVRMRSCRAVESKRLGRLYLASLQVN